MKTQIFRIVFEDDEILVIEKLQPYLSQPTDEGRGEALFELISRVKACPIFPVHRLDREVLGLMIFAKNEKSAASLSQQFRERTTQKTYWAHVLGHFRDSQGDLVHFLSKNSQKNYVTVFPRETPGAKRAELSYRVLNENPQSSELEIRLKTGRSHQIRAQLAKEGHPILGDAKYGRRFQEKMAFYSGPIQLKSVSLVVTHPQSATRLEWGL